MGSMICSFLNIKKKKFKLPLLQKWNICRVLMLTPGPAPVEWVKACLGA